MSVHRKYPPGYGLVRGDHPIFPILTQLSMVIGIQRHVIPPALWQSEPFQQALSTAIQQCEASLDDARLAKQAIMEWQSMLVTQFQAHWGTRAHVLPFALASKVAVSAGHHTVVPGYLRTDTTGSSLADAVKLSLSRQPQRQRHDWIEVALTDLLRPMLHMTEGQYRAQQGAVRAEALVMRVAAAIEPRYMSIMQPPVSREARRRVRLPVAITAAAVVEWMNTNGGAMSTQMIQWIMTLRSLSSAAGICISYDKAVNITTRAKLTGNPFTSGGMVLQSVPTTLWSPGTLQTLIAGFRCLCDAAHHMGSLRTYLARTGGGSQITNPHIHAMATALLHAPRPVFPVDAALPKVLPLVVHGIIPLSTVMELFHIPVRQEDAAAVRRAQAMVWERMTIWYTKVQLIYGNIALQIGRAHV
mgnify:CR=1 FL=1